MLQAAVSTNMWILTNGLNCGATVYISSAIESEIKRNRFKKFSTNESFPLLLGISYSSDLIYGAALTDFDNSQVR